MSETNDAMWSLQANRRKWGTMDPVIKLTYLQDMQQVLHSHVDDWADNSLEIFGCYDSLPQQEAKQKASGEKAKAKPKDVDDGYWFCGILGRWLQNLQYAVDLESRKKYGYLLPDRFRDWPLLKAFPRERADPLWLPRTTAEIWLPRDVDAAEATAQGEIEGIEQKREGLHGCTYEGDHVLSDRRPPSVVC